MYTEAKLTYKAHITSREKSNTIVVNISEN